MLEVQTAGPLGLPRLFWNLWLGTLINKAGTFVLPFLGIYLVAQRGYSVAGAGAVVSLYRWNGDSLAAGLEGLVAGVRNPGWDGGVGACARCRSTRSPGRPARSVAKR